MTGKEKELIKELKKLFDRLTVEEALKDYLINKWIDEIMPPLIEKKNESN